jgi:hypothetical protein
MWDHGMDIHTPGTPWSNSSINRQNIPMPHCYTAFNFNHTGNQYYVLVEMWLSDTVSMFIDELQGGNLHMNFQTCYIVEYQQFTRVLLGLTRKYI